MHPRYHGLVILAALLFVPAQQTAAQPSEPPQASDLRLRLGRLTPIQQDEVVWLARCLYSESDRAHEQRLVAWVVRNRVETNYRGQTYRQVILEPRQFSAFNEPSIRRNHILSLNRHSLSRSWRQALAAALDVYQAPAANRPFHVTTRHFYSPISMAGGRTPDWAKHATPLSAARLGIDPQRFKFFAGIDENNDPPVQMASETEPATRVAGRTRRGRTTSLRDRLRSRRLSGRVKRPVRPHLDRRGKR